MRLRRRTKSAGSAWRDIPRPGRILAGPGLAHTSSPFDRRRRGTAFGGCVFDPFWNLAGLLDACHSASSSCRALSPCACEDERRARALPGETSRDPAESSRALGSLTHPANSTAGGAGPPSAVASLISSGIWTDDVRRSIVRTARNLHPGHRDRREWTTPLPPKGSRLQGQQILLLQACSCSVGKSARCEAERSRAVCITEVARLQPAPGDRRGRGRATSAGGASRTCGCSPFAR